MMTLCGSEAMNWSDICWEQGGIFLGVRNGSQSWDLYLVENDKWSDSNISFVLIIWLVVWNIFYFPINLGFLSSSQVTNSYFSEGWLKTTHQIICCIRNFWPCPVDFPLPSLSPKNGRRWFAPGVFVPSDVLDFFVANSGRWSHQKKPCDRFDIPNAALCGFVLVPLEERCLQGDATYS